MPNLCLAFLPIYALYTLFGIIPLEYTRTFTLEDPVTYNNAIKLNKVKLSFCIIILLITIAQGLSTPFYILQTSMPSSHPNGIFIVHHNNTVEANKFSIQNENLVRQTLIMKMLNATLVTLMSVSTRIVTICILKIRLANVFDKIREVDKFLEQINNFESIINTKKHFMFGMAMILFFITSSFSINIHYIWTVVGNNNFFGNIWSIILMWSSLTGFCGDILFAFCVYLIRVRFKFINTIIRDIESKETSLNFLSKQWLSSRQYL